MQITTTVDDRDRYRPDPSVAKALKTPKILVREVLAGLVVALALIPEAISFSIIAGVDPRVGLYASFVMAVVIAFTGGRPAMITAATGAVAVVIALQQFPNILGVEQGDHEQVWAIAWDAVVTWAAAPDLVPVITAVAVAERGPGSNTESSPNI